MLSLFNRGQMTTPTFGIRAYCREWPSGREMHGAFKKLHLTKGAQKKASE